MWVWVTQAYAFVKHSSNCTLNICAVGFMKILPRDKKKLQTNIEPYLIGFLCTIVRVSNFEVICAF